MSTPIPAITRTLRRVQTDANGCWIFTGAKSEFGYGRVGVGSLLDGTRRHQLTHRVVYEALVGPVPEGLQLDHLCRVPACCNPEHLEPVTPQVNQLRSTSVSAINAAKTHCPAGHEYAGENLLGKTPSTGRKCRACNAQRKRDSYRAKVAAEGRELQFHRPVAVCATTGGYKRHRRLGEPACADCLAAWSADSTARQARTRAKAREARNAADRAKHNEEAA